MKVKLFEFKIKGDERGLLVPIEGNKDIPFEIKRIFYIFGTKKNIVRGKHAQNKLNQILIAVSGSCKILLDDGKEKKIIKLEKPNIGLYMSCMVWHEMFDFTKNCVLLVLASDYYNGEEYIRDYQKFLSLINKKNYEEKSKSKIDY